MNRLAAWLSDNSARTVVLPNWCWLIAYEFDRRHLLFTAVDRSRADASESEARAIAAGFADRMAAPSFDVSFQVEDGTVVFSVDGGPFHPLSLTTLLRDRLGDGVLRSAGSVKPVNVVGQVTSPFQIWQRASLSPTLIAQDFDGWVDGDELCALEFKQVRRMSGWRPYRDDSPNFASILACMGPPSYLVVVAAPQDEDVSDATVVAAFLLTYTTDGRAAFHLDATSARDLADLLDAGMPESSSLKRLKFEDWKGRRR